MTPRQSLQTLITLYSKPDTWCQGSGAVDSKGDAVMPDGSDACKWCLWGACFRFNIKPGDVFSNGKGELFYRIVNWNDDPKRTQADVLAMLKHKLKAA